MLQDKQNNTFFISHFHLQKDQEQTRSYMDPEQQENLYYSAVPTLHEQDVIVFHFVPYVPVSERSKLVHWMSTGSRTILDYFIPPYSIFKLK